MGQSLLGVLLAVGLNVRIGGEVAGSRNMGGQGMMCMGVRVFHAACFAGKVKVLVGSRELFGGLDYGQVTDYGKVGAGFRNISVISEDTAEELMCETMPFFGGRRVTLALLNTMGCMILVPMEDCICGEAKGRACLRAANFSCGEGPFDLALASGETIFPYLIQARVSSFIPALPGTYDFVVREAGRESFREAEANFCLEALPGQNYTVCVLGTKGGEVPISVKIL